MRSILVVLFLSFTSLFGQIKDWHLVNTNIDNHVYYVRPGCHVESSDVMSIVVKCVDSQAEVIQVWRIAIKKANGKLMRAAMAEIKYDGIEDRAHVISSTIVKKENWDWRPIEPRTAIDDCIKKIVAMEDARP